MHNINKLQLVQNFAARVLTNTKKFDHISPVLRALCWPSVKNQLLVRDATMLYKIVNGLAPPYLECYVNKRSAIHSYNTRSRVTCTVNGLLNAKGVYSILGVQVGACNR